ncbi:divalent-cation tolerance protein CutA [Oceanithermus sp.]
MTHVALITVPDEEAARRIARALVEEGLAACVNLIPGLTSIYTWQGKMHEDAEWLLLAKTTAEAYPRLEARVSELHPYEVPEVLALPVERGLDRYLAWVQQNVK